MCEGVPATYPSTSMPALKPCTLRSEAWHRAGQSGKGNRAVFSQLHLTEQSLCALLTGVPISYPPIHLLCQEQNPLEHPAECSVLPWCAGPRGAGDGCPSKSARQGALLRLCFAAPQPSPLENEVSFLSFSGSRSPPASSQLWLCFMLAGLSQQWPMFFYVPRG